MPPSFPQSNATVGGLGDANTVTVRLPYIGISKVRLILVGGNLQYQQA